jgi:CBS domain-containing protein
MITFDDRWIYISFGRIEEITRVPHPYPSFTVVEIYLLAVWPHAPVKSIAMLRMAHSKEMLAVVSESFYDIMIGFSATE